MTLLMMVAAALLFVVMLMTFLMMVAAALLFMMVVMPLLDMLQHLFHHFIQCIRAFYCFQNSLSIQL
jgi:hypothetical protein